jgi:acetylornithine deacetylase/succinyl-diaminopimelate desuccinylase-like protein
MKLRTPLFAFSLAFLLSPPAQAAELTPAQKQFREIYQELVEINTTDSVGDTVKAAEAMAARLKAGGVPEADIKIVSSGPRKGNLVARLRGQAKQKPLLLLAHIDVVEAKREDWQTDPFKLQETDGKFIARGAIDDKAMAAIFVANMIEYVKEGFKPDRDIILALTADEELGNSPHNGVNFILKNHPTLIEASLAINEGGGGVLKNGKPARLTVQHAEKVYQTFNLELKDRGGHSSQPRADNPIYRLAQGLTKLSSHQFPIKLTEVTRAYFEKISATEEPRLVTAMKALLAGSTDTESLKPLLETPQYNNQIHTTCVATMLEAGHAENALPQSVKAVVNCRLMPGEPVEDVRQQLIRVLGDEKITVTAARTGGESPAAKVDRQFMGTVERIAGEMWPGVPVIPTMSAGGTDSRALRRAGIAAYGVSGILTDPETTNAHGLNENVGVKEVYDGKAFLYRLVKELSGAGKPVNL